MRRIGRVKTSLLCYFVLFRQVNKLVVNRKAFCVFNSIKTRKVMANKKKKTGISQAQMKKMFEKHKIRKCNVDLVRFSIGMYLYALMLIKFD